MLDFFLIPAEATMGIYEHCPTPVARPLILIYQFISFTMINEHEVIKQDVSDGEELTGKALKKGGAWDSS